MSLILNHGSAKEASLPQTTGSSRDHEISHGLPYLCIWDVSTLLVVELGKIIFSLKAAVFSFCHMFSAFQEIFSFVRSHLFTVDLSVVSYFNIFKAVP